MKIYIIRHGDPDYSIDSLTEKGWREAELLSQRLIKLSIDDFYCSPLGRAKDTASCTLEKIGKEAEVLYWLREFDSRVISPFTGNYRVSWDLPPSFWGNESKYYEADNWKTTEFVKNSRINETYNETVSGIDSLLERYGWKRDGRIYRGGEDKAIALFCHFALGITALAHLLGIPLFVAQHNFFLAPTSVTTLVTETDKKGCSHFRAVGIGDISHLYAGGEPMSESGLFPNFEK